MADRICLRALGRLELTRGSITIPLLQRRRRFALFAFLALARPPLRCRDSLHAMFWPESDHHRARKALNGAIYALRQELGDDVLVSRGDDEIGVAADIVWCDARAFDEAIEEGDLARGLDLYAGDLMAGFFVPGTYGFEHWLDSERDRLRRAAYDAAWQCAERAEQSGSLDEAVRWARRAVEMMLDDERGVRRSMSLLDRVGDRRGAIQMYEHFAQQLKEEFGTKPAPETRRLIATILARDEPRALRDLSDERWTESANSRVQPATPETTVAAALPSKLESPVNPSEGLTAESTPLRETLTPAARAPKRRVAPRRVSSLFAVAAALVIIAGVWSAQRLSIEVPRGSDSRGAARLVISRFEPLSVDSELALLASAITVALTQQLAEVSGITVVTEDAYARSTSAQAGRPVSTATPPFFLVRGSVLPSQTLVRVGVDLIDARSGSVLRSTRIDRPAGDTLQLIDEVAQQVAGLLRIELGREIRLRRWRAAAGSARALELLHRAEIDRRRAQTLREQGDAAVAALHLARADSLLASAERQDPGWVDLTIWRAQVASDAAWLYSLAPLHDTALANEWLEAGITHADRAVARSTLDGAALELRGMLHYWSSFMSALDDVGAAASLRRAERDLRSALALDAERARAWSVLSAILYARGDFASTYAAAQRAYRADAYLEARDDVLIRLAVTAHEIGRDSLAWEWCSIITADGAARPISAYCRLHLLAWGDERFVRSPPDPWAIVAELADLPVASAMGPHFEMLAATVLARQGLVDSARAVVARATRGYPDSELLIFEASARVATGETDSAAALLRRYVAEAPARRHGITRSRRFLALDSLLDVGRPTAGHR